MRVLSLFDGMGGARIALDQLGIDVEYYASEIDRHAIRVAQRRYPDIVQLGRVEFIHKEYLPRIDLLIGGSACTSLSQANRDSRSGLDHGESKIFWEYVRLWSALKPECWLFENVASMSKSDRDRISQIFGVRPWVINSALVSAQQRLRCYWTNLPITSRPPNQKIYLSDIIESGYVDRKKALCLTARYSGGLNPKDYLFYKSRQIVWLQPPTITKTKTGRTIEVGTDVYHLSKGRHDRMYAELGDIKKYMRKLTPAECENLQNVPIGYTMVPRVSQTQRYKMLGNGFTIDVIKWILKELK